MKLDRIKIKILGVPWTLEFVAFGHEELDGETDDSIKLIKIRSDFKGRFGDVWEVQKQTIRHEIIHAYLLESGLGSSWKHDEWGHDETMIDWFARMYPRIKKTFDELGI